MYMKKNSTEVHTSPHPHLQKSSFKSRKKNKKPSLKLHTLIITLDLISKNEDLHYFSFDTFRLSLIQNYYGSSTKGFCFLK